ncbi:CapA family protein [Butyrivibrio sp.]|uniref:CapA family protein n=1 Tax=Butyrivibrio sp. TaxID=28121 RepID=UPI0025BFAD34|nr:CapA family protein [Butyrivibrio sp.]MBQ9302735.1 CapA family protein [Butyrivibrio sp.]
MLNRKEKYMQQILLSSILSIVLVSFHLTSDITVQPIQTVTISFAGDCTLGSYKGSNNKFNSYWNQEGPKYYLQNVQDIFANDDITFVNLEGPLTDHPQELVKTFSMRGEPEYTNILTAGSVEIVNLSNNHIYDCGQIGFTDTINNLQAAGIKYAGEGYSAWQTVNDIHVCFLGYQGWQDTNALSTQIADDINIARAAGADIICVEFHWSEERTYYPNDTQTALAHFTIDSGADIVVGAHPHVLQGVERYHDKIIAYSLGNFCFGANNNPADKDTMILQVTADKVGHLSMDIIPCTISSIDQYNDFCPTIQSGTERGQAILNRIKQYSKGWE